MPSLDGDSVWDIARELKRNGSKTVITDDPEGLKDLLLSVTNLSVIYEQEMEMSDENKEIPIADTYNFYLETNMWG